MDDNNLFNDAPTVPAVTPTEQKFTIGDKEYTQVELNDLVAKGNQYNDIETKFNTKLDKVVPDYTRASQEAAELRGRLAEIEKAQFDAKAAQGNLSQEEIIKRAKQEAQGIGLMTDENTPALIRAEIEGYDLRRAVDREVDSLSEKGIDADPKVILRYMDAADIESPVDAIAQLYGPQVKMWQEAELNKNKPSAIYTEGGSNAGSFKLPPDVKVTDANVMDLFRQSIGGDE